MAGEPPLELVVEITTVVSGVVATVVEEEVSATTVR